MNGLEIFSFFGVGKLLIYLLQSSPLRKMNSNELYQELFACDFCLGFWVYLFLGIILKQELDIKIIKKSRTISAIVLAGISTFFMHILSIGWKEKFGTYVIE